MAATHTSPTLFSDSQPRGPEDFVHVVSTRRQSIGTLTTVRTRKWQDLLPDTDINGSIALSTLRCIVTLVSLALLVTDIPRTGLGVYNLLEYFPSPLMPSTAVRVGPFDYPISHIWRLDNGTSSGNATDSSTSTEFAGLEGTESGSATRVWPYQYDTTSIGLRGAVELLNMTEFPDFLLYKDQSGQSDRHADSFLELGTVFSMLDAFIGAAQTKLNPFGDGMKTLRYATKHNWVDRFHHYIVQFATKNPAWRLHSLHATRITSRSQSLGICTKAAFTKHSPLRPRFCNHPGIWKCQHPVDNSFIFCSHLGPHRAAASELAATLSCFFLELDVVVLSSHRLSSTSGALRLSIFDNEALEVVVLTRGRRWGEDARKAESCSTVFVDDYRYELDIVQTNLVDWYAVVSMFRGGAQLYGGSV